MSEARAFWVAAPGRGEIRVERLRPPQPGELLIRARASGISRGTETLVFRGEVPQSEWQRMRCPFQLGEFPGPVKYGYAVAGIVENGAAEWCDRRVFCLHPHQDRFIVPHDAVVPIPDDVPERRATLAANMETAVNGLWDAMPGPGDRIAVIGAGVVGTLVAALAARLPGAEVELIDIDPSRAALATAFGCDFAAPQRARSALGSPRRPTGRTAARRGNGANRPRAPLARYGERSESPGDRRTAGGAARARGPGLRHGIRYRYPRSHVGPCERCGVRRGSWA